MAVFYVTDDLSKKGRAFTAKNVTEARAKVQRLSSKSGKPLHLFWDKNWWEKLGVGRAKNPMPVNKWTPVKAVRRLASGAIQVLTTRTVNGSGRKRRSKRRY